MNFINVVESMWNFIILVGVGRCPSYSRFAIANLLLISNAQGDKMEDGGWMMDDG